MGKISPVSAKYIVHSRIEIDGIVDRPDVVGAIFGQTEGLLGSDLELRELQRSGRIGRIEVNLDNRSGKTQGVIIVPSSLDKAETCIIGAALEIIQRIGPCNAKVKVQSIEDVRISKRQFVIERAKELLKNLVNSTMPDSQELTDEVAYSVRIMEITEYGRDRLPAGPAIDESDEVIVVEGRADVLNLLKHGIKNAIAINGTSVPQTVIDLSKEKIITVFVDGDRGGDLIIQEMLANCEVDFVTKAPDGKEVEEIQKKEIHKALRSRVSPAQFMEEHGQKKPVGKSESLSKDDFRKDDYRREYKEEKQEYRREAREDFKQRRPIQKDRMSDDEKEIFSKVLEDLVGTKGACILDDKLNILGKVPITELETTMKSLTTGVYAIVLDGTVTKELVEAAEKSRVKYLVGMESAIKPGMSRVNIATIADF